MKRILIASILGLAISTMTTYGQAGILFEVYAGVQWTNDPAWAPPGRAGSLIEFSDGLVANLLWQLGSMTGDAGLRVPVGLPSPGDIMGPVVVIPTPGYGGGPITLTVQAWTGADYASATARGSLSWMIPALPTGPEIPATPLDMPGPLIVQYIPEPSVLALIGLGMGTALIARRRT